MKQGIISRSAVIIACIVLAAYAKLKSGHEPHFINEASADQAEILLAEVKENSTEHGRSFFIISEEKLTEQMGSPKLVYLTSKIDAGTVYDMIFKVGDNSYTCVTIFEPLRQTGEKAYMTDFHGYGTKSMACSRCYGEARLMIDCIDKNDVVKLPYFSDL